MITITVSSITIVIYVYVLLFSKMSRPNMNKRKYEYEFNYEFVGPAHPFFPCEVRPNMGVSGSHQAVQVRLNCAPYDYMRCH